MSAFPNNTFAADGVPLYLSSTQPITTPSPLVIQDTTNDLTQTVISSVSVINPPPTAPTLETSIALTDSNGSNTFASINLANKNGNENIIAFNVNQPGYDTLTIDNSNGIESQLPITVLSTTLPEYIRIEPPILYGVNGGSIDFSISNTLKFGNYTEISDNNGIVYTYSSNQYYQLILDNLSFYNSAGSARIGVNNGGTAYFGNANAPLNTPGVQVNSNNSTTILFTDGSNVGALQQVGSNIVLSTQSSSNAISVEPNGDVTVPNLTLSNIYATLVDTSNISNASNITTSNIDTSNLNSNSLANLLISYPNLTVGVGTAGFPGVWINWFDINIDPGQVVKPSLDVHISGISVAANNPPNYNWFGGIGVAGDNFPLAPPNCAKIYTEFLDNGAYGCFSETFCLQRGVDYDSNTTLLKVRIVGTANNPSFAIQASDHNVQIRAFPF